MRGLAALLVVPNSMVWVLVRSGLLVPVRGSSHHRLRFDRRAVTPRLLNPCCRNEAANFLALVGHVATSGGRDTASR